MKQYNLGVMGGDGIGPEVTAEAAKLVETAGQKFGFSVKWNSFPFGADYYLQNNVALPESGLKEMAGLDAMIMGAIGDPRVKPGPLEQGILLALRFHFDQYVNLRPAVAYPGVPLPVALPAGKKMDTLVVRENTEDFYMGMGNSGTGSYQTPLAAARGLYQFSGSASVGLPDGMESAFSLGLMTKPGIERITRYAAKAAKARGEDVVHVVSKANAVPHLYGFWDTITKETLQKEFPELRYAGVNVDAMCYLLARQPAEYGVILCPNLFGDIVSDLLSGLAGGLGMAAAGNIGDGLSMFEPVHGSAPTIAGTGKANPLAAILSGAMMLEHIGETDAAKAVDSAVRVYLESDRPKPIETGGTAVTAQVGDAVSECLLQAK